MIPLFFGSAERRLFGVYSPASDGSRGMGVVVCPPLGQEYMRAHRTLRVLATRLAEAGFDVLRFDYFGSGDSGGPASSISVTGMVEDASHAIDELRDIAAVRRVAVIGLRFGARVALEGAAGNRSVSHLVLWDPVLDGAGYAHDEICRGVEMHDSQGWEWKGFPIPRSFVEELQTFPKLPSAPLPRRILALFSSGDARAAASPDLGSIPERDVRLEVLENAPSWVEEGTFGVGAVPVDMVNRIVAWL